MPEEEGDDLEAVEAVFEAANISLLLIRMLCESGLQLLVPPREWWCSTWSRGTPWRTATRFERGLPTLRPG